VPGTEDADKASRWLSKLYKGLSAPLLITVVGALLAGYLIPRITSQVEDHRKAREIQTSLVQDMSEAVAPVVATGKLLATRTVQKAGEKTTTAVFNDALLEWETKRASISARLLSYFDSAPSGGQNLPEAWGEYSDRVEDLYYLSTTGYDDRCVAATAVKEYLTDEDLNCQEFRGDDSEREGQACNREEERIPISRSDPSFEPALRKHKWRIVALCDQDSKEGGRHAYERGPGFFNAYKAISKDLLERERDLLDAVRTTTPAGF
jgi:hypothetical protein